MISDKINGFNRLYDYTDKEFNIRQYVNTMLARTLTMFSYKNLPDTIPARFLESFLQETGYCGVAEHENKLYAYYGGLGGERDVYYQPTILTVANPAQNISKMFKIGEDCVLCRNTDNRMSLLPMFYRYAALMVENDISIRSACINLRAMFLLTAGTDNAKKSAEEFMRQLVKGNLAVLADELVLNGISTTPLPNNSTSITQCIELQQYTKASWYNEIGLNANYNMKRESINSSESQMNADALRPLIDNMFECRKDNVRMINDMFNTDISVDVASVWYDKKFAVDMHNAELEATVENIETDEKKGNVEEVEVINDET